MQALAKRNTNLILFYNNNKALFLLAGLFYKKPNIIFKHILNTVKGIIIFLFLGIIENAYAQKLLIDPSLITNRDSFMCQMNDLIGRPVLKVKPNIFYMLADSFLQVDRVNRDSADFSIIFYVYVDYDGEVCLQHLIRGGYENKVLDTILNQPVHAEIINCPNYLYGKKIYSYFWHYKIKK